MDQLLASIGSTAAAVSVDDLIRATGQLANLCNDSNQLLMHQQSIMNTIPSLIQLLSSDNTKLQLSVCACVLNMCNNERLRDGMSDAIPYLCKLLKTTDENMWLYVVGAINNLACTDARTRNTIREYDGIEPLVHILKRTKSPIIKQYALETVATLSLNDQNAIEFIRLNTISTVVNWLLSSDIDLVTRATRCLYNLSQVQECIPHFENKQYIHNIVSLFETSEDVDIIGNVCDVLGVLSSSSSTLSLLIRQENGVNKILELVSVDAEFQPQVVSALWNLSQERENRLLLRNEEELLETIVSLLEAGEELIVERTLGTICTLCLDDVLSQKFMEMNILEKLLSILFVQPKSNVLFFTVACIAVLLIHRNSDNFKQQVIEQGGLKPLISILKRNSKPDTLQITASVVLTLINESSNIHDLVMQTLKELGDTDVNNVLDVLDTITSDQLVYLLNRNFEDSVPLESTGHEAEAAVVATVVADSLHSEQETILVEEDPDSHIEPPIDEKIEIPLQLPTIPTTNNNELPSTPTPLIKEILPPPPMDVPPLRSNVPPPPPIATLNTIPIPPPSQVTKIVPSIIPDQPITVPPPPPPLIKEIPPPPSMDLPPPPIRGNVPPPPPMGLPSPPPSISKVVQLPNASRPSNNKPTSSAASGGKMDLLEQIKQGKTLKKVSKDTRPPPKKPSNPMNDLISMIQARSFQLKKVKRDDTQKPTPKVNKNSLAERLHQAMFKRRTAVEQSDSDSDQEWE
jgi:hypothetical protein